MLPVASGVAAVALLVPLFHPALLPWSLPLVFVVVPAAQLALAPVWRASGVYRYHSPTLFTLRRSADLWELHGGTAYDYLLVLQGVRPGRTATRLLVGTYLAGLLDVIAAIEAGAIPGDARLVGTPHFVGERTVRRLGFRLRPVPLADRIHLVTDLLSLTAMFSYAQGRFAVPRVWRARRMETTAAELARCRPVVERLVRRLDKRAPAAVV